MRVIQAVSARRKEERRNALGQISKPTYLNKHKNTVDIDIVQLALVLVAVPAGVTAQRNVEGRP